MPTGLQGLDLGKKYLIYIMLVYQGTITCSLMVNKNVNVHHMFKRLRK
jgi:hypothetical protein